ncbi:MAG: APC family permease [Candidatus Aminicenantes bacterium]|jgi:amino acid transporter
MGSPKNTKKLRLFDIVLFNVCGILSVDTIAAGASMGVQGMTWRILGILFFFLPYGLATAELGSSWPKAGGIYVWTRQAFGDFWGTMVSWLYWINVVYWMSSMFVTFAAVFLSTFFPGLSQSATTAMQTLIGIALVWTIVFLGRKNITASDFVTNTGALIKTLLFLLLGFFGILYALRFKLANSFTPPEWAITWDSTLAFMPVVVYNFLGFELVSSFSDKLDNPRKNIPKAIFLAGILIAFLYILSAFGMLAIFRADEINIVTGISDAFRALVLRTMGQEFVGLYYFLIIVFLLSLYTFVFAWAYGANCVIAETGLDKKVKILGHKHPKHESPDYAFVIMGIIATVLIVGNSIGMPNIQQIFWTIFALSSVIFLLPYCVMFPAVLRLRRLYPDRDRPYIIPFGKIGLWATVICGEFFVLIAILFFFVPPKNTANVLRYELSLCFGVFITLALGSFIYFKTKKSSSQNTLP